jgi:chlorobactene glucosyltransferase
MTMEYQMTVLGILVVMGLIAAINLLTIRSLGRDEVPADEPFVSVLIPARNEEKSISACLDGLTRQAYPNYEIIVLDDNSVDETGSVVRLWSNVDQRVTLLHGGPLPPGWVGKNYACHQLSLAASGEILLFVDADTTHGPLSIASGVAALEKSYAGLVTVIPHQVVGTFWERIILPLLHFATFCFLPLPAVHHMRDSRFAMANGQYLMFRKEAYRAIGGHASVMEVMVEDVWLSRRIKESGFGLRIMDGGEHVGCRMYTSLGQIWQGFSKNLFAGFKFSVPAIAAVMLLNILTSIAPFFFLMGIITGILPSHLLPAVAAQVAILLGIRTLIALRFRLSFDSILLHPLGMAMVVGIAVNSVRWVLFAGGTRWKGREYTYKKHLLAPRRSEA